MKNKGFTLIEMLAVIALLAIIGTITAVSVKNIKKNQDEENKLNIISAILTGARNYITEKSISISDNDITISKLKTEGYVDFDYDEKDKNYKDFNDTSTVQAKVCNNKLKFEIIYEYKGNKISDCGCAEQTKKDNSYKLCEAGTDGKAGWDTNGIYYNTSGIAADANKNIN